MENTCYLNRIWIDEKIILAATEAGLTNDTFQGRLMKIPAEVRKRIQIIKYAIYFELTCLE